MRTDIRHFRAHRCRTVIKTGEVVETLKTLDANTIDGCLFDGPYGLTSIGKRFGQPNSEPPTTALYGRMAKGFMNQTWDGGVPSLEACQELLRVCKPGSWMLAFGHPRTFHRLMCNIEDAGWELRDTLMWLFGQGFPKSHNLGRKMTDVTWNGHGFALKPAYEPIIMAMKPLDGSFAVNARTWGVAGLNIDGCRIGTIGGTKAASINKESNRMFNGGIAHDVIVERIDAGRWPANVLLDEEAARLLDIQGPMSQGSQYRRTGERDGRHKGQQLYGGGIGGGKQNAPDCYGDVGGVSRFFYCAKANKLERSAGLDGFPIGRPDGRNEVGMGFLKEHGVQPQQNHHPCVKPIALTQWLATLILPPKRLGPRRLLVPYCGSGSELIGAMLAGWDEVFGIEGKQEYVEIAKAQIKWWRVNR